MLNIEHGLKIWCCEDEEVNDVLRKCSREGITYDSGADALMYDLYAPMGLFIRHGTLHMEWNKEYFDGLELDRVSVKEFVEG